MTLNSCTSKKYTAESGQMGKLKNQENPRPIKGPPDVPKRRIQEQCD